MNHIHHIQSQDTVIGGISISYHAYLAAALLVLWEYNIAIELSFLYTGLVSEPTSKVQETGEAAGKVTLSRGYTRL